MDVAGTQNMSNEELQKEWYRMGSQFRFGSGENSSVIAVSGLDEQFENSLELALDLIKTPTTEEETLEQLKDILLKTREDQKSSPPAIARALYLFNRYGEKSPMLEALTSEEIKETTLDELLMLPSELLTYNHTIAYTGSLPLEDVVEVLRRNHIIGDELQDTPEFQFRRARQVDDTELLVVDQQTAQAQVRIEFADGIFDEEESVISSLYTNYFGSGMSSVVFQELREARALAYSASARYAQGGRLNGENLVLGAIGTQTDKTVDALQAFIDLIDNMPSSSERFEESVNSLLNRYRTSKLNFREVIGAVRSWERMGFETDPRRARYQQLQDASMEDLLEFQEQHVKNRAKLISIVGDLSIIDVEELEQFGTVQEIQVDQLFVN
jgi:predicted Zn-dependent peptidase